MLSTRVLLYKEVQGPFSGSMLGHFRRCGHSRFLVYMEVQARNRAPEESRVVLGNPKKTGISPGKDGEGTSMLEPTFSMLGSNRSKRPAVAPP